MADELDLSNYVAPTVLEKLHMFWKSLVASINNPQTTITVLVVRKGRCTSRVNKIPQFSIQGLTNAKFLAFIKLTSWLLTHVAKCHTTTIRDFYYQDVELFQRNQNNANDIVRMMMDSFDVSMDDLKLYPTQKGLVYYMSHSGLIPVNFVEWLQNKALTISPPLAIILLEKDAVYQALVHYIQKLDDKATNLMIITGKGYPDRLTLRFTKALHELCPKIPIVGFVDSDVYGISILNQFYLHGIPVEHCGTFLLECEGRSSQTISERDARLGICQLNRWLQIELGPPWEWKRELCRGLVLRKKTEMNVSTTNLCKYILDKVLSQLGEFPEYGRVVL